jgi:archaellum component FlaC
MRTNSLLLGLLLMSVFVLNLRATSANATINSMEENITLLQSNVVQLNTNVGNLNSSLNSLRTLNANDYNSLYTNISSNYNSLYAQLRNDTNDIRAIADNQSNTTYIDNVISNATYAFNASISRLDANITSLRSTQSAISSQISTISANSSSAEKYALQAVSESSGLQNTTNYAISHTNQNVSVLAKGEDNLDYQTDNSSSQLGQTISNSGFWGVLAFIVALIALVIAVLTFLKRPKVVAGRTTMPIDEVMEGEANARNASHVQAVNAKNNLASLKQQKNKAQVMAEAVAREAKEKEMLKDPEYQKLRKTFIAEYNKLKGTGLHHPDVIKAMPSFIKLNKKLVEYQQQPLKVPETKAVSEKSVQEELDAS